MRLLDQKKQEDYNFKKDLNNFLFYLELKFL